MAKKGYISKCALHLICFLLEMSIIDSYEGVQIDPFINSPTNGRTGGPTYRNARIWKKSSFYHPYIEPHNTSILLRRTIMNSTITPSRNHVRGRIVDLISLFLQNAECLGRTAPGQIAAPLFLALKKTGGLGSATCGVPVTTVVSSLQLLWKVRRSTVWFFSTDTYYEGITQKVQFIG